MPAHRLPRIVRPARTSVALALVGLLSGGLGACSGPTADSLCERAVAHAAEHADEPDLEDVDGAIRACPTVAELDAAVARHPGAFRGRETLEVVRERCRADHMATVPICQAIS